MFLSAVSSKGATNFKPDDALGVGGDLSPATLRVEFDEPIQVKNADIELVSCKIAKQNAINVDSSNNSISVRMAGHVDASVGSAKTTTSELYTAFVPPNSYTADNLGKAIANALNGVMPCNGYKGWSGLATAGVITLTYEIPTSPGNSDFFKVNTVSEESKKNIDSIGVKYIPTDGLNDFVKFNSPVPIGGPITNILNTPNSEDIRSVGGVNHTGLVNYQTCGGIDAGSDDPAQHTRTAVNELGIWEGVSKTGLQAIIRPVECVIFFF